MLFETIPLLLPMLMLAVLFCIAMCVQACSGTSSSDDDSAKRSRQRSKAPAAPLAGADDVMHDRYGRPLWSICVPDWCIGISNGG